MLSGAPLPDGQLFLLTEEAAESYVDEGLDGDGNIQYLDLPGSVSASIEIEIDGDYDPTHMELNRRLIHNASL